MLKNERFVLHSKIRNEIESYPLPYQSVGWPAGIQEFIREVAFAAAMSVIDEIYTQSELDEKVDKILLNSNKFD